MIIMNFLFYFHSFTFPFWNNLNIWLHNHSMLFIIDWWLHQYFVWRRCVEMKWNDEKKHVSILDIFFFVFAFFTMFGKQLVAYFLSLCVCVTYWQFVRDINKCTCSAIWPLNIHWKRQSWELQHCDWKQQQQQRKKKQWYSTVWFFFVLFCLFR